MDLELDCKWHFAEHLGGREDGPNDPMQDNFKKTPYASLIRESIQNSLDVQLDSNEPVRMEFSIGRIRAKEYSNFFELKKHIQGCINHFKDNDDAKRTYQPMLDMLNSLREHENLYFVKVSDYNTRGMSYIKGDTSCPFYAFVRAAGVSSKNDATAGGSYGYGKAAYFYISPLRTIFVSTKTKSDQCFFEGVSSLCTHTVDDSSNLRVSVGYYDNNNGEPVSNPQYIPEHFRRTEPGTDIYILGINAENRKEIYSEMVNAVLRNFWMAIESNKLEVTINVDKTQVIPSLTINQTKLPSLIHDFFPDESDDSPRERSYNPRPYWEAVHFAGTDNRHIFVEEKIPEVGQVSFYALKQKKARDKILYMRNPLMLVKARRTQSSNGFYGVFICKDTYGNKILRKTENPAHNEWDSSNWRENDKIVPEGRAAIKAIDEFIIRMMEQMFINSDSAVQQILGMDDLLYIPTAVEDDDELESESLVGDIIDQNDNEGNSISTEMTNPEQSPIDNKPAIGKVMITNNTNDNQSLNKEGDFLSGHGEREKTKKGGGGLSTKRIEGHFGESQDGVNGSMYKELPVKYRSFAQILDGKVIHKLIIHSDYDIKNGRIDLIIGGEQSDEAVSIESCSIGGEIKDNSISGISINKGKNELTIVFADNMKHAVKLDAYELK